MPSNSKTLDEEGVLIDNFLLVSKGRISRAGIASLARLRAIPARNPDQNLGDIRAQVAACARGAEELLRLMSAAGREVVLSYMRHVRANAAASVRRMLSSLPDGHFRYEFDDGAAVRSKSRWTVPPGALASTLRARAISQPTNFNAPASICRAAVLYVIRTCWTTTSP